ncbi:MAG: hypothetical protein GDA56_12240 [Hormoscilla sp. GM7CHS1pb]|nr:hypothetical protein [Hormoscilla sp. GM7CHS1pb]
MKIYVRSRGEFQDYCWLSITEGAQQREEHPIIGQVRDLIQSEAPSVVLARFNGQLLLLVTGEESSRTDSRTRQIRNSVAWVGQESDESVLRAIAVRALKGSLREEIDRAVRFGGSEGFQVSYKDIKRLAETGHAGNAIPDTTPKIALISPTMKNLLADELAEYRLPPHPEEGSLVVATGIKNRETLEAAGVWRSLSSDGRLPEDWEVIRHSRFLKLSILMDIAKQESFKKICIGIGVLVLILGWQFDNINSLFYKFLSNSNGSDVNGSDVNGSDVNGSDVNGSDVNGSDVNGSETQTPTLDDIGTVQGTNNDGDVAKITISEELEKIEVVFRLGGTTSNLDGKIFYKTIE